jgi:hypothetical protein
MRRLLIAASLLAGCGVACVSHRPVQQASPLHPVYRADAPKESRPTWQLPVPTASPRTASQRYHPSWYPHGRRISPRWTHIVLHHSATETGGAARFDKHHRVRNGWDELGYHFVIGNGTDTPDGYIEVGPRWNKQKHGAHCKTPNNYFNEHGIGVCLVGDFTKSRPTPRQLASLQDLLRFLSRRCGIPPERVTSHGRIKRRTQCPGRYFPLTALRRSLITPPTAVSLP